LWVALAGLVTTAVLVAVLWPSWHRKPVADSCGVKSAACAVPATSASGQPTPSLSESPKPVSESPPPASASPTGKPAAKASATAAARPSGPCTGRACGYPNASNTGPGTRALTRHDGNISIRDNGAVISEWDLHGSLDIYANDVTVTDCRITSTNWWGVNLRPGFTGLKITRCMVTATPGKGLDNGGSDYAVSNMGSGSIEVAWNDISQFGNPISMGHGNIHDNYIHDLAAFVNLSGEYQHTDAVISNGSDTAGLVIRHNTILNQTKVEQGGTAAVGLFADTGPVSNTTVEDNWLAGGAYAVYGGGAGATGIRVVGNVFSTQYWPNCGFYGAVAAWNAGGAGNVWSNNVTSEGTPVLP
jgi:hypothetical protein